MTKTEVMKELKANGTAQNRKVYRRHGVQGEMFGVSYAALGKLKKKINRGLAAALSNVAAEAPSAKGRMEKWTASKNEMVACTGWHTLASIAREDNGLPDSYFSKYVETIESKIHTSKNWVKYAMNNALINIGVRNPALQKKATAAAKRIGGVDVDHGETGCKTPDAATYIKKTVAYRKAK